MTPNYLLLITILVVVLICVFFYQFIDTKISTVEGLPSGPGWDYEYLNNQNAKLGFNVGGSDDKRDEFIERMIKAGVKYSVVDVPPKNPQFPEYGKGKCMADWYNVKDEKTGVQTQRTVRLKNGWVLYDQFYGKNWDGPTAYNFCLNRAKEWQKKFPSINVFSIQNGGECFVGDTNYLALDHNVNLINNNYRWTSHVTAFDMSGKLPENVPYANDTVCSSVRARGNGGPWANMVYAYPLDTPLYRFDDAQYTEKIKKFISSGLTTYDSVSDSIELNNKLGFTTIEGNEGMYDTIAGLPVTFQPSIKDVNNHIFQSLLQHQFIVTKENLSKFLDRLGMTNLPFNLFLDYAKWFGINSHDEVSMFIRSFIYFFKLPKSWNVNPSQIPLEYIVYMTFVLYWWLGIPNKTEFDNFKNAFAKHKLDSISKSLIPDIDFGEWENVPVIIVICILVRLGVKWNQYDQFFSDWNSQGIKPDIALSICYQVFLPRFNFNGRFNYQYTADDNGRARIANMVEHAKIHNLSITNIQINSDPIANFKSFDKLLTDLKVTYNEYADYYAKINEICGLQQNMSDILPKYKKYVETVKSDSIPTANISIKSILYDFIYRIDPINDGSPKFFKKCSASLGDFFDRLTSAKLSLSDIMDRKRKGETYPKFMNVYESFTGFTEEGSKSDKKASNENKTISQQDMFSSISEYVSTQSEYLYGLFFGSNVKEGMPSDDVTYNAFFGNGYSQKLKSFEARVNARGLSGSDNVAKYINALNNAIIRYNDYNNLEQLFDEFNGSPIEPFKLIEVLNILSKLGVTGVTGISRFIQRINWFQVKYKTNFTNFIKKMQTFCNGPNVQPDDLVKFIKDLQDLKFSYDNDANTVDAIVDYLVYFKIYLKNYINVVTFEDSSGNVKNLDSGFMRRFIKKLYNKEPSLYDIKTPGIYNPSIDPEISSVAPILCNNISQFDGVTSMIDAYNHCLSSGILKQNLLIIISFFYKEEVQSIIDTSTTYTLTDQHKLMKSIAAGIIYYSDKDLYDPATKKLYMSIAKLLNMFPVLSFNYLSEEIKMMFPMNSQPEAMGDKYKCTGHTVETCSYYLYVDPDFSLCKASTKEGKTNYRPTKPITKAPAAMSAKTSTNAASKVDLNDQTVCSSWRNNGLCLSEMRGGDKNMIMQGDGNVVIYKNGTPLWASNTNNGGATAPYKLYMQDDGHLVSYDKNGTVMWNSNNYGVGIPPYNAVMQGDGNFVIYDSDGSHVWASNTY